jgi:hypothetical protein
MAEAGRAPAATPRTLTVNIDAQYKCDPKHGSVLNDGEVTFHVASNDGCYLYTDPADAFDNEPAASSWQRGTTRSQLRWKIPRSTIALARPAGRAIPPRSRRVAGTRSRLTRAWEASGADLLRLPTSAGEARRLRPSQRHWREADWLGILLNRLGENRRPARDVEKGKMALRGP